MSQFRLLEGPVSSGPVSVEGLSRRILVEGELAQSSELAGLPCSEGGRRLAETVRRYLTERLEGQVPPARFPLSVEQKRRYQRLSAAWLNLARLYTAWLQAADEKAVGRWLTEALFCLRQVVVIAGICHWPVSKDLWSDVHRLYRLGRQKRVAGLGGVRRPFERVARADNAYIHLLMLGLADLAALRPVEVRWLDGLLEKWAPLVGLTKDAEPGWGVDGRGDRPARWSEGAPRVRLDFRRLLALLDDHRALAGQAGRFHPDSSAPTIDLELLQLWCRRWDSGPARPNRPPLTDRIELILGLDAIFRRLRGEAVTGLPVEPVKAWVRIPGCGMQIGDLVGLFEAGGSRLRSLAVVDRLYAAGREEGGLRVQFRTLADRVRAVGLQPWQGRFRSYQPALLLEEDAGLRLILPLQDLPEGTRLRLLHGSAVYPVRLGRPHHSALGVMSFSCHRAASPIQK